MDPEATVELQLINRTVLPGKDVLAWEASHWLISRAASLASLYIVEKSAAWSRLVKLHLQIYRLNTVRVVTFDSSDEYVNAASSIGKMFDIAFAYGDRCQDCARSVAPHLKVGASVFVIGDYSSISDLYRCDESAGDLSRLRLK